MKKEIDFFIDENDWDDDDDFELTEEQYKQIEIAIEQVKNGQYITHEEMMERINKKMLEYKKLKS